MFCNVQSSHFSHISSHGNRRSDAYIRPFSFKQPTDGQKCHHFALYFEIYNPETISVSTTVVQIFKRRSYVIRQNSGVIFILYTCGSCKIFRRSQQVLVLRCFENKCERNRRKNLDTCSFKTMALQLVWCVCVATSRASHCNLSFFFVQMN